MNLILFRLTTRLIRYGLVFATLCMTFYCGMVLAGVHIAHIELVTISWFWGIILFLALCALPFCRFTKIMFAYVFTMSRLISLDSIGRLSDASATPAYVCMFFVGFGLTAYALVQHGKDCPTCTATLSEKEVGNGVHGLRK